VGNHGCFLCHALGLFEIKVDSSSGTYWHKTISRASKEAINKVSAMCLLLVCFAPVCFSPTCSVCACSQLLGFWLSFCSGFFVNSQKCPLDYMSSSDKKQTICGVPILAWHQLFHLENGLMLSGNHKSSKFAFCY
jgi:hypothetical protein